MNYKPKHYFNSFIITGNIAGASFKQEEKKIMILNLDISASRENQKDQAETQTSIIDIVITKQNTIEKAESWYKVGQKVIVRGRINVSTRTHENGATIKRISFKGDDITVEKNGASF